MGRNESQRASKRFWRCSDPDSHQTASGRLCSRALTSVLRDSAEFLRPSTPQAAPERPERLKKPLRHCSSGLTRCEEPTGQRRARNLETTAREQTEQTRSNLFSPQQLHHSTGRPPNSRTGDRFGLFAGSLAQKTRTAGTDRGGCSGYVGPESSEKAASAPRFAACAHSYAGTTQSIPDACRH